MDHNRFPSQAPTRKAWQGMMNRCYTATNKDYPSIGGKGIKVCEEWKTYETFLADMKEKPDNSQLARHDKNKDFTPDNCYWMPKVNSRSNNLYSIWKGVRRRCGLIGKTRHAETYQMRGITIDQDWASDFHAFAVGVGERPSKDHQLDRVDNDLGYVPGNVRWVLPKQNANNRSNNIYIEMNGERRTLQEWAEEYEIKIPTIHQRWAKLFAPAKRVRLPCQQICPNTGAVLATYSSIKDAVTATGLKYGTVAKCLSGGNATAGGFVWRYID